MMDDVGRSSVKSAASAVAPVAVPVALLLLLLFCPAALFRCHSVLLQCHQQLDEQEEPAKPASQQEEEKKRQSVIERFGLVWFGLVLFCLPLFPCLNIWDSLANSAEISYWNISLPCATSSLRVLLLLITVL